MVDNKTDTYGGEQLAATLQQQLKRVPLLTKKSQNIIRSAATLDEQIDRIYPSSAGSEQLEHDSAQKVLHLPSRKLAQFASTNSLRTQINKTTIEEDGSDRLLHTPQKRLKNVDSMKAKFYLNTPMSEIEDPLLSISSNKSPNYGSIHNISDVTQTGAQTHVKDPELSSPQAARNYYDDFTSVDWVRDYIHEINTQSKNSKSVFYSFIYSFTDWFVLLVICILWALIAFVIDKFEELLIDIKRGVCASNILLNEQQCLSKNYEWKLWPFIFQHVYAINENSYKAVDFTVYVILSALLAYFAVRVTLTTKTTNPLIVGKHDDKSVDTANTTTNHTKKAKIMYNAYGSGVPEVKTVLSGFTIRKFLGSYTLFAKSLALVFAIASGLSLGKEGPYVHLATCCGNICSRLFKKYKENGIERRIILSASAAAGVSLAFGSPLGGVLFSLEEVSYYLPGNQLFKTFFAAITSTLFLKFLNPYGTGKAVLFDVNYQSDWVSLELPLFATIGIVGGVFGALFCKFVQFWASWFRSKKIVSHKPVKEVLMITVFTAIVSFANPYTNISVSNLLAAVASPCFSENDSTGDRGLCPLGSKDFMSEFQPLLYAFVVKIVLTSITFGLKVPAGIYVPSMIIGALGGRLFGMFIQYISFYYRAVFPFNSLCSRSNSADGVCIDLGIYAMIGAASTMAGVTRMNVTLAVIMFELTSSYNHVLPISVAIAFSNFIANLIEPRSLYETLIIKNDFPFLDKRKPHIVKKEHQQDLKYIMTSLKENKKTNFYIDVSNSNYVPSMELKRLLTKQQSRGLMDGCIPILKNDKFVGIIPGPELQLSLDKATEFSQEYRLQDDIQMKLFNDQVDTISDEGTTDIEIGDMIDSIHSIRGEEALVTEELLLVHMLNRISDLTRIVETSPIILNINSPLSLVEIVFANLGNRYIVIMDSDKFVGFLHKKDFIDYCRKFD